MRDLVAGRRRDPLSIRRIGDSEHGISVPLEQADPLAVGHVPHRGQPVFTELARSRPSGEKATPVT